MKPRPWRARVLNEGQPGGWKKCFGVQHSFQLNMLVQVIRYEHRRKLGSGVAELPPC